MHWSGDAFPGKISRSLPQFYECVCSVFSVQCTKWFFIWNLIDAIGRWIILYYLAGNKDQDSFDCWRESFTQLDVPNPKRKRIFAQMLLVVQNVRHLRLTIYTIDHNQHRHDQNEMRSECKYTSFSLKSHIAIGITQHVHYNWWDRLFHSIASKMC